MRWRSGIFNGGLGMVMACAPLHRRPGLIGIMIGISQIGMISGPLIGGAFTEVCMSPAFLATILVYVE